MLPQMDEDTLLHVCSTDFIDFIHSIIEWVLRKLWKDF